jgi:hypothetical protein
MTKSGNDISGRPWLRQSEVEDGMIVELDGDFTCHAPGNTTIVKDGEDGLFYFRCAIGKHYLIGQEEEDWYRRDVQGGDAMSTISQLPHRRSEDPMCDWVAWIVMDSGRHMKLQFGSLDIDEKKAKEIVEKIASLDL